MEIRCEVLDSLHSSSNPRSYQSCAARRQDPAALQHERSDTRRVGLSFEVSMTCERVDEFLDAGLRRRFDVEPRRLRIRV